MGSPLGPVLANAFMAYHETRWLEHCPLDFKPLFYRRYVDDTFLVFKSEEHVQKFLSYLNSRHPNIEFTAESESNNQLPFLDILVTRSNNCFTTSVFRKPTYTGLTTKFSSFIPIQYKRNLIVTFLSEPIDYAPIILVYTMN